MIDAYVILAPVLLLAVIALVRFIGCGFNPTAAASPTVSGVDPVSGSTEGGTPVTISGANFFDIVSVTFDQSDASSVSASGDGKTILALTPAHAAGAVDISVSNSTGTGTLALGYNYSGVTQVETVSQHGGSGTSALSATLNNAGQNRTVVATILWRAVISSDKAQAQDARFKQIATDYLNPHTVTHFYAQGISTPLTVTVTFPATNGQCDLVVTSYDSASPTNAPDQPTQAQIAGPNLALAFPTSGFSSGDLAYAAAVVRTPPPQLALAGNLAADPTFVSEFDIGYFLAADRRLVNADVQAGQISVNAINSGAAANAPGYIFAMRIQHS